MSIKPGTLHGSSLASVLDGMVHMAAVPGHRYEEHSQISLAMIAVSNCATIEEALIPHVMYGDDNES